MVNTHNAVFLSTIFGSKIISDEGVWRVVKNVLDLLNNHSLFCAFCAFRPSRNCVPARWKEVARSRVRWRAYCGVWCGCITNLGGILFERGGRVGHFVASMGAVKVGRSIFFIKKYHYIKIKE